MIDEKKLIEALRESNYHHVSNSREKSLLDRVLRIVEEQPKIKNTISFKHFHLLADSTLKSWGKEALLDYIHSLYYNWLNTDYDYNRTIDYANSLQDEIERLQSQLLEYQRVCKEKQEIIEELQDNPPLKFEEFKEGMWVWDKREEKYIHIHRTRIYEYDIGCFYKGQKLLRVYCDSGWYDTEFIENRFYRKQVD